MNLTKMENRLYLVLRHPRLTELVAFGSLRLYAEMGFQAKQALELSRCRVALSRCGMFASELELLELVPVFDIGLNLHIPVLNSLQLTTPENSLYCTNTVVVPVRHVL